MRGGTAAWLACVPVLVGCPLTDSAPDAGPSAVNLVDGNPLLPRCKGLLRQPRNPRRVAFPAEPAVSCQGSPICFDGSAHALAWRVAPGRVRVTVGTATHEYNASAHSTASAGAPGFLGGSRWMALVRDGDGLVLLDGLGGSVRRFPMPAMASGEKPGGLVTTEDGVALWLRGGGGAQRLHWLVTPPVPPQNGFPAAAEDGTVAGWVHRDEQGMLFEHTTGEFWPATPQRLPLTVQASGSTVLVRSRDDARLFDGRGGHAVVLPSETLTLMAAGAVYTLDPLRGLFRVDASGSRRVWPVSATVDLAGKALPPGAERERVQATAFGDEILVIERIRLADCKGEDRVHLVKPSGETATVRTVASDDKVRMHPRYAQEAFRWVEADSNYVDMDQADRAVFVAE